MNIYTKQVIDYVLPKPIKIPEKELVIMDKHIEIRSITLCCQSPYKTTGKEFITMNEYIETKSLAM